MVTLVSDEQSENAYSPMLLTPLGMVTSVSTSQFLNAEIPILVTPSSMTTDFTCERKLYHGALSMS